MRLMWRKRNKQRGGGGKGGLEEEEGLNLMEEGCFRCPGHQDSPYRPSWAPQAGPSGCSHGACSHPSRQVGLKNIAYCQDLDPNAQFACLLRVLSWAHHARHKCKGTQAPLGCMRCLDVHQPSTTMLSCYMSSRWPLR